MADESALAGVGELKSLRTVFIGTNVIFWILAIFMINIMFQMNRQLSTLNRTVTSVMAVASNPNLDGYEIVVPGETEDQDKVAYKFRRIMMPEEMYDEMGNPTGVPMPPPPPAPAE